MHALYIKKNTLVYLFIFSILFIPFSKIYAQSGSLVDSIEKEILSALKNDNIPIAIGRYNDLFSVSYKENKKLLENICTKIIEHVFKSKDIELKNKALEFIEPLINVDISKVLLHSLEDSEITFRDKAIKILSSYNNEILYPELSTALKSDNLNIISASIEIVKNIKQKIFISQIVQLFEHEDLFIRVSAIKAIANLSPAEEEIKKLNELLLSPSDQIRSAVIETFLYLPPEYINIQEVISDNSENVQLALLKWAEINPGELADSIIRRNLYSKNMEIFSAACKAAIKSGEMIERIDWTKLTKSIYEDLRLLAIRALKKSSELFDDEDIVKTFFNDSSKKVRVEIAEALLKSDDSYSESILNDILKTGQPNAKEALLYVFGLNMEIICPTPVILDFFAENNAFILTNAIPLIKRLEINEQKSIVEKLLTSNKINVRSALFEFIASEKKLELYSNVYQKGLNDAAVEVQISALKGLSMLSDSLRNEILDKKFQDSIYKKVREECILECAFFESELLKWEWIDKGYKDEFPNVRKASLYIAKDLEDKDKLLELFSDALFDDDENVRSYALKELQNPGTHELSNDEKEKTIDDNEKTENKKDFQSGLDIKNSKRENKTNKLMDWLNKGKKQENEKIDLSKKNYSANTFDVNIDSKESKVEKKLQQLLSSGKPKVAEQAEDILLELKDEKSILNIKNRLFEGTEEERKKAASKLGYLNDTSLIPVLREQLKREQNLKVQFELAFAIWKMLPNLK